MARWTKADLEKRLGEVEAAFDKLMASHKDCTSGLGFDMDWAKRVERETEAMRYGIKITGGV